LPIRPGTDPTTVFEAYFSHSPGRAPGWVSRECPPRAKSPAARPKT